MTAITLRLALSPADRDTCFAIRRLVFVEEQGVPLAAEFDEHEDTATHLLALADEQPAGTLRWRRKTLRRIKIERVAVLRPYRGLGLGQAMLHECLRRITAENVDEAVLHAQVQAQDFYRRFQFEPVGESFIEDGIEHIAMWLPLHTGRALDHPRQ